MWKSLKERICSRKPGLPPIQAEPFLVRFERTVHRLASDPAAPSIPARQCFDYFGSDLLRYVPTPMTGLWPTVRVGEGGSKDQSFLDGKDWDQFRYPMANFPQYKLAHDLANGVRYQDTEVYRSLKAQMASGVLLKVNGVYLGTDEKIDRYCEYVQWLIDSVRKNGLCSRHEAAHLFEQSFEGVRRPEKEKVEKEIQVAVDARGEFLRLHSGRHRLAVAYALGIKEVPAKIQLVHVGWIMSLVRETGARPDGALRQWLGRFRSAAERVKVWLVTTVSGLMECAEIACVLA